jgi:hypothetical protein
MELSIIIVNYKSKSYLERCLESIKKFPPGVTYEVIVIDNDKDNIGFARGVNKGIRKSKGRYLLLLNPDIEVKKDSLNLLYNFATKTSDAGVVGARLLNPNGSIQSSVINPPGIFHPISQKYAPSATSEVPAVVGAAFLITPDARKRVGLMDERYFMYFEDLDYCRRVRAAGLKVYYYPESEFIHHHGVSGRDVVPEADQWKRLIPGSKLYHGLLKHYLIYGIAWIGQKWLRLLKILNG